MAQKPSHARPYEEMADWLRAYRNGIVHGRGTERPAYGLDLEDGSWPLKPVRSPSG